MDVTDLTVEVNFTSTLTQLLRLPESQGPTGASPVNYGQFFNEVTYSFTQLRSWCGLHLLPVSALMNESSEPTTEAEANGDQKDEPEKRSGTFPYRMTVQLGDFVDDPVSRH